MTRYPILFGFRDLVAGHGYVAGVETQGRLLLVKEDDSFWAYGVNPGGLAGRGETEHEAMADFREGYRSVLYDIAEDAATFIEFKSEVEAFFDETNRRLEAEWTTAVEDVKADRISADWLQKQSADDTPRQVRVVLLQNPDARDNELDKTAMAA